MSAHGMHVIHGNMAYVIVDTTGETVGPSAGTAATAPVAAARSSETICVYPVR